MIVTERLTLTKVTVEDADEMVAVLGDDRLHQFTGGHPETVEQLRDRYRRYVAGPGEQAVTWRNWIVRTREDDVAVGTVQATISHTAYGRSAAELAWVVGPTWQGRGFATEAGRALVSWVAAHGIDEVIAHIHPAHHASARVAQRIGLHPTADRLAGETTWRRSLTPGGPSPPPGHAPGGAG
jgi:RimJ/RimL family protein N-acetyltransferase